MPVRLVRRTDGTDGRKESESGEMGVSSGVGVKANVAVRQESGSEGVYMARRCC